MARIRTIKPEFWTDELIGRLSRDARLLFLGLISNADDEGRFRAHPAVIRAAIFPYDDVTLKDIETWLAELANTGRVQTYVVDGQTYGAIVNFAKHQKINRPTPSRIPDPPKSSTSARGVLVEPVNAHGAVDEASLTDQDQDQDQDQGSGIKDQEEEEEREEEEREELGTRPPAAEVLSLLPQHALAKSSISIQLNAVIARYQEHHPKAKPGKKERRLIESRLKEGYSVEDLCKAIDGCHRSPFHLGENDQRQAYLGLELILRDSDHVAKFVEIFEQGLPEAVSKRCRPSREDELMRIALETERREQIADQVVDIDPPNIEPPRTRMAIDGARPHLPAIAAKGGA